MSRRTAIVSGSVILMVVFGVWMFWPEDPITRPSPPTPNGFDSLMKAAKMSPFPDHFSQLETDELRAIASSNKPVVTLLREGLLMESLVPVVYLDETRPELHSGLRALGQACHLFALIGILEERDDNWDFAAQSYADMIHCAEHFTRGAGSYIRRAGMMQEQWALERLIAIRGYVSTKTLVAVAQRLESIDAHKETFYQTLDWDQHARHVEPPLKDRIWLALRMKSFHPRRSRNQELLGRAMWDCQLLSTQVQVWFAYQAFQENHGTNPASVFELVPQYLRQIPADGAFGRPIAWTNW